jgi:hypothetical protein
MIHFNSKNLFMTEAEFKDMEEIFKRQGERIEASIEYADELLTRLKIKHLLVPRGTNKTDTPDASH